MNKYLRIKKWISQTKFRRPTFDLMKSYVIMIRRTLPHVNVKTDLNRVMPTVKVSFAIGNIVALVKFIGMV